MEDCIFCKIVKGEIPYHKVYEDDDSLAFLDVEPCSKGHTVIIPKLHAVTIFDLNEDKLKKFSLAIKRTSEAILDKLSPENLKGFLDFF